MSENELCTYTITDKILDYPVWTCTVWTKGLAPYITTIFQPNDNKVITMNIKKAKE